MKAVYCVITDYGYLARAVCLYRSLEPFMRDSGINLYCVDAKSYDVLVQLKLPWAAVISHDLFGKPEIRHSRSHTEYCWTLKPVVLLDAIKRFPARYYIYLDADMMAFGDPMTELASYSLASIVLSPHRLSATFKRFGQSGCFNAGFVAVRDSEIGCESVKWWEDRCHEICPSQPTNGTYADQTYLGRFPEMFPGHCYATTRQINAAPWNIEDWKGEPITLYHFQGFRMFSLDCFDLYCGDYKLPEKAINEIYWPYLRRLIDATLEIKQIDRKYPYHRHRLWYRRKNPINL